MKDLDSKLDDLKQMKEFLSPSDAADCSEVWVVTGCCSKIGRWWIHAVHADESRAANDVVAANNNSNSSTVYGKQCWVVIPQNA